MKTLQSCFKTTILLLSLCVFASPSFGKVGADNDNSNPLGCRDMGYEFQLKTLKLLPDQAGARQSMYFVFNRLPQTVNLSHMRDEEGTRVLYLNHSVSGRQWGVVSTSEKELKFICSVNDPRFRQGRIIDCADSVKVCEYNNIIYGLNNRGNYWLENSYTRNAAVRAVVKYGIIPAQ